MKNKLKTIFAIICIAMTSLCFVRADLVDIPYDINNHSYVSLHNVKKPVTNSFDSEKIIITGIVVLVIIFCSVFLYLFLKQNRKK